MGKNPIDEFLESLDVGIEQTESEQSTQEANQDDIRVRLSKKENKYYINCFILGRVAESELPGRVTA